ncbi:MAG: amino acid permease [archaeon]|nr:MAG: amino acid permease [archaeon]
MKHELRKEVGFKAMIFLAINSIIGSGLFFLPSIGAKYAGPASIISWLLIGTVAILMSFVYSELVGMYPRAGGVFEFASQAFKEFPSFMAGWISWLVANVTISMLIVGAIHYIMPTEALLTKIVVAVVILLFFNLISYFGMKTSKFMLLLFSFFTIIIPATIILFGLPHVDTANFSPFFVFPLHSIFIAMFFISETFVGWEAIAYLSEEAKNPEKVVPKAMIIATVFIVLLCLSLVFVSLGTINWETFSQTDTPFSMLSENIFGSSWLINYFIFAVIIGSAASWVISTPRLLLGMARGNLFLKSCEKIHWRFKTPHIAIAFQTLISFFVILIGLGDYLVLLSLLLPFVMILYTIVLLTFIKLRMTVTRDRPFYSPVGASGATLLALLNIVLLMFWLLNEPTAVNSFVMCIFLVFLGTPIYILVKLQDRRFVEFLFDHICYIYNMLIHIWYGKLEMEKVIGGLRVKENHNILDYGCGAAVANLIKLSEDIRKGTIVAVDVSKKQLDHCVRKVRKMKKKNIILVKEEEEMVKFKKNTFDGIVSVGVMSYQSEPLKLLMEFRRILKKGKRLSILDFGKAIFFKPPAHLKDSKTLRKLFKDAGFKNIKVEQKKKLLTKYYFITAEK